jgi:prevent-host-death family protein
MHDEDAIYPDSCHDDHVDMTMDKMMEIPAGEFKAKCLQLMDRVARNREPIVITKRGKPVAKLVPPDESEPRVPLFGYMAGTGDIRGDIVKMPRLEWSALTGEEDSLYADLESAPASSHVGGPTPPRKHK